MGLEAHEVHDLEVRDPELGQDVHVDGRHAELVPDGPGLGGVAGPVAEVAEQRGDEALVPPLHVEIRVQRDREVLV